MLLRIELSPISLVKLQRVVLIDILPLAQLPCVQSDYTSATILDGIQLLAENLGVEDAWLVGLALCHSEEVELRTHIDLTRNCPRSNKMWFRSS